MRSEPIDVWSVATFDEALRQQLAESGALIRSNFDTDVQIFLDHDLGRGPRKLLRPEKPHYDAFERLETAITAEMGKRTVRAYHYTRLDDAEVARMRSHGIELSTPETLRARLEARVAAGALQAEHVEVLLQASPFQQQLKNRAGMFWMTSHPITVDDSGVTPLMRHWGGEVASMWLKDEDLLATLAAIGKLRIVELAVPLASTPHAYRAAKAVIASFGRSIGAIPDKHAFDLYAHQALAADAILCVHSEGGDAFAKMGQGYPAGFVDLSIGRWKELTGEDD